MTVPPADTVGWVSRARQLADRLTAQGDLLDPAWRDAVTAVARHVLVPGAYQQEGTGAWQPVDVTSSAGLDLVYSPVTLITALADRGTHQEAVSSSTKPDLVLRMLETLDIHDGHKVLEIGTGSGYNAALLAHRLGDERVFSIDVDHELVNAARQRLATIGLQPTLVTADGAGGLPEHGPYDRIIVTCSVTVVPWAWADQLTLGGRVLVDVKPGSYAGNLVMLYRHRDRLEGRFTRRFASFMSMRRRDDNQASEPRAARAGDSRQRTTTTPPNPWYDSRVVWMLAQVHGLPSGIQIGMELDPDTRQPTASLLTALDGSWATISLTSTSGHYTVVEGGPTALWEHVEHAHRTWLAHDQPDWPRLGLTITTDEQHLWIDHPGGTSWRIPA
ncbi:MAG: methyltransferase domain-containing protein [Pseudonocardiaceae bacterium]